MEKVSAVLYKDKNYTTELDISGHKFIADEPIDKGGDDNGPNPYALVASGLAACTLITLRMYANRKEWDLGDVYTDVKHHKDFVSEPDGNKSGLKKDIFERTIKMTGNLDEAQIERLRYIADRCPVHRTLSDTSIINTTISKG